MHSNSHPGVVGQREMSLPEFVGTLPMPHIARDEYQKLYDVYVMASRLVTELQNAENVPQQKLQNLNNALAAYEGRPQSLAGKL